MEKFTTPKKDATASVQCELDGQILTATKPKAGLMLRLARMTEGTPGEQAEVLGLFLERVFDEESATYLMDRIEDPDDDLDIDDLEPVVDWLYGQFTDRPTGSSAGSTRTRRPTKRSTAGVRSVG